MRIFIAESNQDLQLGLQMLFHQEPGMYVTGIAIDSEGLLVQVEASRADVLIVAWRLPGASMEELLPKIRGLEPAPRTVVLSVRPEARAKALSAGADAFISKSASPDELLEVVSSLKKDSATSINYSRSHLSSQRDSNDQRKAQTLFDLLPQR
jgi:DNA-binding NarL/FixJ family response regulator